jgi:Putative abortive phage resistance protein AbiGi, antitoxin
MPSVVGGTNPNWDDMSPFVVHFTKKSLNKTSYDNSLSILHQRRIEARGRFGIGKNHTESPSSVCFSEVPLHQLKRLADKRGPYGIVFRKEYIVERNGGPIMYAYQDTTHATVLRSLVENAIGKPNDLIWKVAPFVDAPGAYGKSSYFFEWEREWRHIGDLHFQPADPAFLIIPEESHEAARHFFDDAERENLGPNYKCPFIDPYWSLQKVKSILEA